MRLIAVVLMSLLTASVHADEAKKLALARELAGLMDVKAVAGANFAACQLDLSQRKYDAHAAFKDNPKPFGAIAPGTASWPKVEAIFQAYRSAACAHLEPVSFAEASAQQYARHGSENDLRAALGFYSSPAGRRFLSVHNNVHRDVTLIVTSLSNGAAAKAERTMQDELRALVGKLQRSKEMM